MDLRVQAFLMCPVKPIIRLGGCPGYSESLQSAVKLLTPSHTGSIVFNLPLYFDRNAEEAYLCLSHLLNQFNSPQYLDRNAHTNNPDTDG